MTPAELLNAARTMLSRPGPGSAGLWSRAAALLGRQAMEAALDDLWSGTAPGIERASMRCQLLCLPAYVQDAEVVGRAAHAWVALTQACHHHPYELPPTAEELDRWLDAVRAMIDVGSRALPVGAVRPPAPDQ